MIIKKLIFVFIFSLSLIVSKKAYSSHVAGVDITYTCLGNDSFLISVNVFRDCSGATWSATNININISSPCTTAFNLTLQSTNPVPGQGINVSQLCPTAVSNCNNGPHPGMQLFNYQAVVVLPPCNFWTFSYAPPCCRNNSLNITPNQGNAYVFSTMNSAADSCNSSPQISTVNPNPYACVNQLICYDLGVTEADGDSLVYSFVEAYQNAGIPFTYNAGYSANQPIPGITIDPHTGKIQFVPIAAGNYVIVVQICEYERGTGILLGCITRDMQWVVNNCNNAAPAQLCQPNSIVNFSGTGAQTGPNEVEVCYGQNFSLTILVSDVFPTGSGQYLTATTNVQQVLPGSIVNIVSNAAQDSLWITISWVATLGANPFNTFNVNVSDNNCPVTATNSGTYVVKVIPSTYAGLDQQICKTVQSAQLNAMGGTTFTWAALPGGSGTGSLSCNVCKSPVATPSKTTSYVVTSDLSSSCKNMDTVTVIVSENYSLNITNDTLICFNDSTISISAIPSINRNFSYKWTPSLKLSSDSIQSPLATPISKTTYNVTVTSDSGCIKTGNVTVSVTSPFPNNIVATTLSGDTVSCSGVPITLDAQLSVPPTSCGASTNPCSGVQVVKTVGNGSFTTPSTGLPSSNAWPNPFAGSQASARTQMIISKSEMIASGITAGTISSLAFNIVSNSGVDTYNGFTIKLGCVNDSNFTLFGGSYWKGGLTTVFNPKTITLTTGWNTFTFDNNYDYSALTHLVVEICFFNSGTPTQNPSIQYDNTAFNSGLFYYSQNQNVCSSVNLISPPVNRRPRMRFEFCGTPNPSAYTYKWWPTTGLNSDIVKQPTATITDSITYTLAVTDTAERCFDTSKVKLFLTTIEVSNDTAVCPNIPFQLFASGNTSCLGGATYQWAPVNLVSNPNIPNPTATITQTTKFYVTYQDNCGCTITDSILVTKKVIDSLNIIETPPTCGLDNGAIKFQVFGGASPYQFSIDSGKTLQPDSVFNGLNNMYLDLLVIDEEGCILTKRDTFTNTAPIIDSIWTKNLDCFESNDGVVKIYSTGGIQPVVFSVDGGNTYQPTDSIINLPYGFKTIIAKSADGCETKPIDKYLSQPDLLEFNLIEDVVSCFNYSDGRLTMVPTGGTLPYTYTWSNSTVTDSILDSIPTGTYTAILRDAMNCQADSTYFVIEPPELTIDSLAINPITCHGYHNGIFQVYVSGGNGGYLYSLDTAKNLYTSNRFDSIGPYSYQIYVEDYKGCSVTKVENITQPDPLVITPTFNNTTICVSNCIEIFAPNVGGNYGQIKYNWTPSLTDTASFLFCPTKNSKFIVYASDINNCISNVEEIFINLYDSLEVEASKDTMICRDFGTNIFATPSGGDGNGFNYKWTPFPGLNNPTIKSPFANPAVTTTYLIELTDNCGSPAVYDSVKITVNPVPNVQFASDGFEGCEKQLIQFFNNSDIGDFCTWHMGDNTIRSTCNSVFHPYSMPGFYDVKLVVTTNEGCSDSLLKPDFIKIYPNPVADFSMTPQPATLLEPAVTFTDKSEGVIGSWLWNFGSFQSSDLQNPIIQFPMEDTGYYPIRLEVISTDGCYDDTVKYAYVDAEFNVFAPNGFTPNGDGLNDMFLPLGTAFSLDEYELLIYDRWGVTVFETKDKTKGWDGKLPSGQDAPIGVYVWKLRIGDYTLNKKGHDVVGNILLTR